MTGLAPLRDLIRRHRRILAACTAGLAAMLAISLLRAPASAPANASIPTAAEGEVAVPIALQSAAHARVLATGDVIDLVAVPRSDDSAGARSARVIARDATVLSVTEGGFGAADAAVIVLAVPRADALAIADAGVDSAFTAWVTGAMPRRTAADR